MSFISVDVVAYPQVQSVTKHRIGGGISSQTFLRQRRVDQVQETVTFRKWWLLSAMVRPRYDPFMKTFPVLVTQLVESDYE